MATKLSILIEAIDRATAPIKAFHRSLGNALRGLQEQAQRFHRAMEQATNLRFASQAVGELSRKLRGALLGPVSAAAAFESAMADVRKVVDFEPGGVERLQNELRALTRQIPLSAAALATIAAAGGQFGLPADELAEFTDMTAKVAVAWDILPDQAGESIAKLSNVFDIPIRETAKYADTINFLSDNAAAKAPQITEALLRVGGNARLFGLLREETAGLVTAMIELGRPPEVAARALNTMLARLQTADAQGKKFQAAMKFMGLSSSEFKKAIEEDAGGALLQFFERLEGLSDANRAKALTFLFGEGFSDEIGILVGSLDKYREKLELLADDQSRVNSVQREFEQRSKTATNGFTLMSNTLNDILIQLGEALLPAIKALLPALISIADWLVGVIRDWPVLTKIVLGFVGAVSGLLALLSPLLLGIAGLTVLSGGGAGAIAGLAAAAAAALAPLSALLAPLAAIAAGAAIGAGAGVLLNNLPKFLGSKSRLSDMLGDTFLDDFDPNAPADPAALKRVMRPEALDRAAAFNNRQPIVNGPGDRDRFSGEVKVSIDSEGRPTVRQVRSDNQNIGIVADVGHVLAPGS